MERQGEVEAEYHAAHSYIQKLQDEISEVLHGILTTDSPPCSPTPSQPRNTPPPRSGTLPAPVPSVPNPHTPHLTPRTQTVRDEDRAILLDTAGRKSSLEDVTNIQQAAHKARTVSGHPYTQGSTPHPHPPGSKHYSRSFDAELYWSGRRISIEDSTPHRPQKDVLQHSLIFGKRRRTSLGEYNSERHGGSSSTLGRRVASLSGHRRSSLGDYQGEYRDRAKLDWTRRKLSHGELKKRDVKAIKEEQGKGASEQTGKKFTRDGKDGVSVYRSESATSATSKAISSLGSSAGTGEDVERKTLCKADQAWTITIPSSQTTAITVLTDPSDPNATAEICRRARELRNSITESIDKRRQSDSGLQSSISTTKVEPKGPLEKRAASRDPTSAHCLQTKEQGEESVNKDLAAGTVVSFENKTPARVASSLCCVSKQGNGGEEEKKVEARDHTDHHHHQAVEEENQSVYHHHRDTDIPHPHPHHHHHIKAASPGADCKGQPAAGRSLQNRPTTLKLLLPQGEPLHPPSIDKRRHFNSGLQSSIPSVQVEQLPQHSIGSREPIGSGETVLQYEPYSLLERRRRKRSDVLQSTSKTRSLQEKESSRMVHSPHPTSAQGSSVNAAGTIQRFQLTPADESLESVGSEAGSEKSEGEADGSSADVRGVEEAEPDVLEARDTEVEYGTEGVERSRLQNSTADPREANLRDHSHIMDTRLQGYVYDVTDTELHGHADDVMDTQLKDDYAFDVRETEEHDHTPDVMDIKLKDDVGDVRDRERQGHSSDVNDVESQDGSEEPMDTELQETTPRVKEAQLGDCAAQLWGTECPGGTNDVLDAGSRGQSNDASGTGQSQGHISYVTQGRICDERVRGQGDEMADLSDPKAWERTEMAQSMVSAAHYKKWK
ncbi:hypothetical protein ACOMHN_018715 [Nucella lapillus]